MPAPSIFAPMGGEQGGEVGDLGFAGAVLKKASSPSARTAAISRSSVPVTVILSKDDVRALEAFGAGLDVAVLVADLRAHALKPLDVQVDGPAADGAASGHGDAGEAGASDEGSEDQRRSAHGLHDLVLRRWIGEDAARDRGAVLSASIAEFDLGAHRDEQLALGLNVPGTWGIFSRTTSSSVRMAAAMQGNAEFFAPLTRMVPSSGLPPRTTNLSMMT